jgi:hypothetical protein
MWWDPREDRIAILMTQRSEYAKASRLYRDFWSAATETERVPGRESGRRAAVLGFSPSLRAADSSRSAKGARRGLESSRGARSSMFEFKLDWKDKWSP